MAAPRTRRGFTLVELLVVITIIGMLMALLLPAIQSAREAGRRNTCANNMRNDGLALYQQAEAKKGFPNYVTAITKTALPSSSPLLASWVVSILPNLEHSDMYQNWQNPSYAINNTAPTQLKFADTMPANLPYRQTYFSQISVLVCPSNSNPDLGDNPLSYVVNTGSANNASDGASAMWPEDSNSGVCFATKKVSLDFINTNDGTSHTVLLSENLQSGRWALDPTPLSTGSGLQQNPTKPYVFDFSARQSAGMVWFITGNTSNAAVGAFGASTILNANSNMNFDGDAIAINSKAKNMTDAYNSGPSGLYAVTTATDGNLTKAGLAYSRPSSNHPGGVNMVFCDGHLSFVNDEIPYHVFTQLMTPFQKQVITTTSPLTTAGKAGWIYTLNEADYQ